MLAASHKRADAELHDRSLERVTKSWQPRAPARPRHDVRLLHDLPERTEIREQVGRGRAERDDAQAHPGTASQRNQHGMHRSVQFVEKPEEPIRRYPGERTLILRRSETLRIRDPGLQKITR